MQEATEAKNVCLDSFSFTELNAAALGGQPYAAKNFRFFVANHCLRRTPRIFPSVDDIDAQYQWVINYVWNRTGWNFRRRLLTGSISTASVVTWSDIPSGESFESLATRYVWYTDNAGAKICWSNADEMVALLAAPNQSTGRPQALRVEKRATGTTWFFWPLPDAAYGIKAEVYIAAPSVGTSATSTAAIGAFPEVAKPIIRDLVLARILQHYGAKDGETRWTNAVDELDRALPQTDQRGQPERDQSMEDMNRDVSFLSGGSLLGGYS